MSGRTRAGVAPGLCAACGDEARGLRRLLARAQRQHAAGRPVDMAPIERSKERINTCAKGCRL